MSFFPTMVVLVSMLILFQIFSAQFIPKISEDSSVEVVNFCRTPQWYIPRVCLHTIFNRIADDARCQEDFRYPAWIQWMFAHVPFLMRSYRNWIMARVGIFMTGLIIATSDVLYSLI